MRNLLGRLHARRLPELLRIADAWGVPIHADSKGEAVATLYRAMTDPRTVRDLWDRLSAEERAVASVLADAPDAASAPTVAELATRLEVAEAATRETALALYRAGVLAREGDDDPLPIGEAPRLLMPREVAQNIRRIEDEMASGDLAQAPLRALIELLDDAEVEAAARTWGMRAVPGVTRRQELISRLLRLVNDRERIGKVAGSRSRDALAIWKVVRGAAEPVPLSDAAVQAGLGAMDKATAARLRAALAELEGALLVWHAYQRDGSRWLFVPREIRHPGAEARATLPPLATATVATRDEPAWRHPDALAWDLLTLLRVLTGAGAPAWEAEELRPRWLQRAIATRLWFGGHEGVPVGYLELLRQLALDEGLLAIDEDARPRHIVSGPQARAWRRLSFPDATGRLRERWLGLSRWVEGEPAGVVDVWGADWRGMRPRLVAALVDAQVDLAPGQWVTLESLAARIAARFPALLGPSFMAATARQGGDDAEDDDRARRAALIDVIAFELAGPFVWFGLTRVVDRAGQPRAVCVSESGAALAARRPVAPEVEIAPTVLQIDPSGEVTLCKPTPERVWALSAFSEQVDLGRESHYRLTASAVGTALAAGIEREQIVAFLERGSGEPLPPTLAERLAAWARAFRRVGMQRAVTLRLDDAATQQALLTLLREGGWQCAAQGESSLLVDLDSGPDGNPDEERLISTLRANGYLPRWLAGAAEPPGA